MAQSEIESETLLVIDRGDPRSRMTVEQAQTEIILQVGAGLDVAIENTRIESE